MCVIYDMNMLEDMKFDLCKWFKIIKLDIMYVVGYYCNFKDFIGFFNVGWEYLEYMLLFVIDSKVFFKYNIVFDVIIVWDILLYYLYYCFLYFIEFLC